MTATTRLESLTLIIEEEKRKGPENLEARIFIRGFDFLTDRHENRGGERGRQRG